jgi:hypothetical protein
MQTDNLPTEACSRAPVAADPLQRAKISLLLHLKEAPGQLSTPAALVLVAVK